MDTFLCVPIVDGITVIAGMLTGGRVNDGPGDTYPHLGGYGSYIPRMFFYRQDPGEIVIDPTLVIFLEDDHLSPGGHGGPEADGGTSGYTVVNSTVNGPMAWGPPIRQGQDIKFSVKVRVYHSLELTKLCQYIPLVQMWWHLSHSHNLLRG